MGWIRIENMKLLEVPVGEIDLQDERFRFSYHFDLEKLLLSIKTVGVISPLMVAERENNRFVIVCGWKRISACRQLSVRKIPVCLVDEPDDFRLFLLSVYENWAVRRFDILEKAEIINKLHGFIKDERKIVKQYFPLLDIPASLSYLDLYIEIARLDPGWKKILSEKKIPLSSIQILTEFTPEDREALMPLILPLNMNKLKQFCLDLYELSKKTGDSPKDLLSIPEIRSVCGSEKLSPLQKADKVRSFVKSKRYPALSTWEKSFRKSLEKARMAKDVVFDASSFFEDGEFSVTFSLFDRDAFLKRISRLKELSADEDLFSLFENDSDG